MVSARDEENKPMTKAEIRDELMTMLFAGHETTASTLAWEFYWLHCLPDVGKKFMAELNSVTDITNYNSHLAPVQVNLIIKH